LYVKQLESAYEEMFERSQNGLEPDHIYVELKDEKVSND
jgi:hypothetical protein